MSKSNSTLIKYKIFVFLSILFAGYNTHAQFTDSTHYHITAASTGSINRMDDGNAYLLNNSLDFGIKKKCERQLS